LPTAKKTGTKPAKPKTAEPARSPLDAIEAEFERREAVSALGGGEAAIARQHAKGSMTALERMDALFDAGAFRRLFALRGEGNTGDGVVGGWGLIGGRKVFAYGWDFTNVAGTCSADNGRAVREIVDAARVEHCPVVSLNDSGGARVQDGVASLYGYSEIFSSHIDASGRVPQLSAVVGPCAGGAVYAPALTDFIVMTKSAFMAVTGPEVMKATTGKSLTKEELGGYRVHSEKSGRVNLVAEDDSEAIVLLRDLLAFLPDSHLHLPPRAQSDDPIDRPTELSREVMRKVLERDTPFDVRVVIADILDDSRFFEVSEAFAPNLVTGFGRLGGWTVGVLANQSAALAGNLDPASARKGSRFIRFCDCFNIPLVTLVDVSGFIPDDATEAQDIEGCGAGLMMAYRRASVPKFSVVVRRAFGGAYDVMCNKQARTNRAFAWPTARFAVMGAPGAVDLLHRRNLARARESEGDEALHRLRNELIEAYKTDVVNPWKAAELGYIDEFIDIRDTRARLAEALLPLMEVEKLKPRSFKGENWPI
jgi:propionyl-CoA carboxylase beta chain